MTGTLWGYYQNKGQSLPPISERAKLFEENGLGSAANYTGTAEQNAALAKKLHANDAQPRPKQASEATSKTKKTTFSVANEELVSWKEQPQSLSKWIALIAALEQIFGKNCANSEVQPCPVTPSSETELPESSSTTPQETPKNLNEARGTKEALDNFFKSYAEMEIKTGESTSVIVNVPYHINDPDEENANRDDNWKDGTNQYAGKGEVNEIKKWIEEDLQDTKTWVEGKEITPDAIRTRMKEEDIGIDCSGFVSQALNSIHKLGDNKFTPNDTDARNLSHNNSARFKKIETHSDVEIGDTLFYDNAGGINHIEIVASVNEVESNGGKKIYEYTLYESAGDYGVRKMEWKSEDGKLYRKEGGEWKKKENRSFSRLIR